MHSRVSLVRISPASRNGLTLTEVLIVLTLLLAVLAVSWPALSRLHKSQQLTQTAMLVQTQISAARMRAIESSTPYEFVYEISGQIYLVAPSAKRNAIVIPSTGEPTERELDSFQEELPAGIVFISGSNEPRPGRNSATDNFTQSANRNWSVPIVFYPDGTSDTSELFLRDQSGDVIEIQVRGLTGMAKVKKVNKT